MWHKLHEKINNSQLVSIPNAGHLVQKDEPTALLSYTLKFLRNK